MEYVVIVIMKLTESYYTLYKKRTFEMIINIVLVVLFILVGWFSHAAYEDLTETRDVNGLFIKNVNYTYAREISKSRDQLGDWVCINTRGMTFPEAYDTCIHECSHKAYSEIFSSKCEEDVERCMNVMSDEQ